ncbi:hypothetical protein Tco_0026536 [Tanacetum coccineum]
MRVFSLVSLSRFRKASQVKLHTRMGHLSLSLQRKGEWQNTFNEMDEYNALVADVKSRMRAVKRVARVPVSLNELEINGNERAYDTGRFIRYPSVGDGNCFFRSGSQGIAGHQGLHVIFRKGTEAWMRAHLHRYKHPNMLLDAFREYLAEEVGVVGSDVGMDVVQGATDLLRTRMVRTYARGSKVIDEVTPFDGWCFYEINLACIPGHVDTLAHSHLYPYHLQGCHLVLDVGIKLLRLGTSTSFTLTMYYSGTTGACMVRKYQYTTIDCRVSHDELAHSEHKNEK